MPVQKKYGNLLKAPHTHTHTHTHTLIYIYIYISFTLKTWAAVICASTSKYIKPGGLNYNKGIPISI